MRLVDKVLLTMDLNERIKNNLKKVEQLNKEINDFRLVVSEEDYEEFLELHQRRDLLVYKVIKYRELKESIWKEK